MNVKPLLTACLVILIGTGDKRKRPLHENVQIIPSVSSFECKAVRWVKYWHVMWMQSWIYVTNAKLVCSCVAFTCLSPLLPSAFINEEGYWLGSTACGIPSGLQELKWPWLTGVPPVHFYSPFSLSLSSEYLWFSWGRFPPGCRRTRYFTVTSTTSTNTPLWL